MHSLSRTGTDNGAGSSDTLPVAPRSTRASAKGKGGKFPRHDAKEGENQERETEEGKGR